MAAAVNFISVPGQVLDADVYVTQTTACPILVNPSEQWAPIIRFRGK